MKQLTAAELTQAYNDCISFQLTVKGLSKEKKPTFNELFIDVPQFKLINQAQNIINDLLPRIEKSKGKQSAEYKLHSEIFESLMVSINILNKYESLSRRLYDEKSLNEYYRQKNNFYENELQKYTTIETLLMKETTNLIINKTTQQ